MQNKQPQPRKVRPLREDYRHRDCSDDDRIKIEAAVGIMKHKDGFIEKRKF